MFKTIKLINLPYDFIITEWMSSNVSLMTAAHPVDGSPKIVLCLGS